MKRKMHLLIKDKYILIRFDFCLNPASSKQMHHHFGIRCTPLTLTPHCVRTLSLVRPFSPCIYCLRSSLLVSLPWLRQSSRFMERGRRRALTVELKPWETVSSNEVIDDQVKRAAKVLCRELAHV